MLVNRNGTDYVCLRLNTFLFNAGIVGLNYLLETAGAEKGKDYDFEGYEFYIAKDYLLTQDLAQLYIDAHIKRYEKETAYYTIINSVENLSLLTKEYSLNQDKDIKQKLDDKYKDLTSKLLSASYKSGYEILKGDGLTFDIEAMVIEVKGQKDYVKKLELFSSLVDVLKQHDVKQVLCLKNIAYSRINMFWENKAFLLTKNAKRNMHLTYYQSFVQPISIMLEKIKKGSKRCIECGCDISPTADIDIAFLKDSVDDTARKTSAFWNKKPDAVVCPICAYVYTLATLGFEPMGSDMLFINNNDSVEALIRLNATISTQDVNPNDKYYQKLNKLIQHEANNVIRRINNIQVIIRKREDKRWAYNFSVIGKDLLGVISSCQNNLKILTKYASIPIKDKNGKVMEYINVYQTVVENLLSRNNQYMLINRLLKNSFEDSNNGYVGFVWNILKIQIYFKGGDNVDNNYKLAHAASHCGKDLRKLITKDVVVEKDADNKLRGFVYQLLNNLQAGNREGFLNLIIRMYSGINQPIPGIFITTFKTDEQFKDLGYAFILGLKNEGRENTNNNEEEYANG